MNRLNSGHATYSEDGKRIWVLARKKNILAYDAETLIPLPSLDLFQDRAINASFPQPFKTAGLALGMNQGANEYFDSVKVCWLKLR